MFYSKGVDHVTRSVVMHAPGKITRCAQISAEPTIEPIDNTHMYTRANTHTHAYTHTHIHNIHTHTRLLFSEGVGGNF